VVLLGSQSRAFRTLHSAFYFPHYAFRISAFYRYPDFVIKDVTVKQFTLNVTDMDKINIASSQAPP